MSYRENQDAYLMLN